MKNLKNFLFATIAIVAATACSKNNEEQQFDGERAAFSVNVVAPTSRAAQGSTSGTSAVIPVNSIRIVLDANTATGVQKDITFTSDNQKTATDKANAHIFYDVINMRSVTVYVNYDGVESQTSLSETSKALAVSCYGKSDKFTQSGTVSNGDKSYKQFTTTVTVTPAVARIEASGIKIKNFTDPTFAFESLKFAGIYLDGACESGSVQTKIGVNPLGVDWKTFETSGDKVAEYWAAVKNKVVLGDFVTNLVNYTADDKLPAEGKCYGYNFFMGNSNPVLSMAFVDVTPKTGVLTIEPIRYVTVKTYRIDGTPVEKFEAGNIYRITSLEFTDSDMKGAQGDETKVAIKATVVVTPWTIKDVTVDWN